MGIARNHAVEFLNHYHYGLEVSTVYSLKKLKRFADIPCR